MDQNEKLIESTESFLCSLISDVADLTLTYNDTATPFQELGIDSFRVLKVIKSLEDVFGTLPKTLLFENFNIADLSRYFVKHHEQILLEKFATENFASPATAPQVTQKAEVVEKVETKEKPTTPTNVSPKKQPIVILEKNAHKNAELSKVVLEIFNNYKNEGSASRGTRNIAPYLFIGSQQKGYFNYSRSKNILLVYAYTGPEDYLTTITEEIYNYCEANNLELTIFSANTIEKVGNAAFTSTPFGVISRILNIKEFTLKGKSMRRLRYLVSKFQNAGNCKTVEYQCGTNKETDKEIAKLIDLWSEPRTMVNPLIYIVKEEILAGNLSPEHRLFLTYLDDTLQNAILISKLSENENGYLMDLEFYPKTMPLGGLEFAIVHMIETLASEGHDMLSLGGTYGCKLEDSPNADPYLEKTLEFLREQKIFNDEGNLQFKNKFRPENTPVFLSRAKENSNPDNVTDVIMMIADPSKAEIIEETHAEEIVITEEKPETIQKAANTPKQQNTQKVNQNITTKAVLENNRFSADLAEFDYNPLKIPNNKVAYDLKTDSWAQLAAPAIQRQLNFLHTQLYQPINIEESLKALFPFSYIALASSGRNAEQAFFKSWPQKGIVLQNLLFPTAIYHEIQNGFSPKEIPLEEVFHLESEKQYKGNLNWDALVAHVEKDAKSISFVAIELANNAAGGAPVSINHLKKVKEFLSNYSIPLVLDATRVIENSMYILNNEKEYTNKTIWEIAKETLSIADAVWVSLAKDFCINQGGLIATNNEEFFQTIQEAIQDDGIGISVIDKKLIAHSFNNKNIIKKGVLNRMHHVELIHNTLKSKGIKIMNPRGVHCVLIDVTQFEIFNTFKNPIASFVAWVFLNTGIRGGAHNTGMQSNTTLNNLVRFAIPIGLEQKQAQEIANKLIHLFESMENIPEVELEGNQENFGELTAQFTLKKYHNLTHQIVSQQTHTQAVAKTEQAVKPVTTSQETATPKPVATQNQSTHKSKGYTGDIAIVGMSGRYPKAKNLDELWNNLIEGKDCVETIPEERLQQRKTNKFTKKYRGGFLSDVDKFDSMFFNIPPVVAEMFDPQERLLLETAWEAIEDAGYYPEILTPEGKPTDIGVFVGAVWTMYQVIGAEEKLLGSDVNPNSFLWSVANRISYCLNLTGPSLSVDTACSSSMTALYLACEAIYNGDCSGAIVGGVNLDLHQSKFDINSFGGALSPDGVCRTFGKGANGYVAGEGVGAIYLKPLAQAEKDGDNIQGVIKGVSINHGGRTSGYMVPDPKAQASLIVAALEKGNIDARTVGYIEAHGTGTELGDPIEISGLTSAFQKYTVENQTCAIGSVKTNIGHLEAAAGIVGIQKVLLQMKHKKLVPSLHSAELNEFIDFENSPFYVEQNVEDWKPKIIDGETYPLRAGISSFGAGGANAHVVIESYEKSTPAQNTNEKQPTYQIFPLSAVKEGRLYAAAKKLHSFIEQDLALEASKQTALNDIGFTLRLGRKSFEHRLVIIASTKEELLKKLALFIDKKSDNHILSGEVQNSGAISRLLNKSEKEGFIKLISESGDLKKLAQLWIEGIVNDWQGLSASETGKRVSLPTYPFADKRHWVPRQEEDGKVLTVSSVAHPLIDINESTFEKQLFRKTFHDKEFFIYDHLVSDIPTLPGVAYLDFARKAGELAAGRKVKSIKNIIWVNPISVNNSQPVDTWIELKPNGSEVQFEVFGKNEEGVKQLNSQGKLTYVSPGEEEQEPEYLDIKSIKERCEKVTDGKDAYPLFHNMGLGLGPSFQVLQEVFKNDDEMLGIMKIPDVCENDFNDFLLHPSLVDGAGQTVMAAHLSDKEASGELVVPYSFGEVQIFHPLTPTCYSYIKKVNEPGSKLSKANFVIVDEDGKVLVKINESVGIPLTDIHEKPEDNLDKTSQAAEKVENGFTDLYYSHIWEPTPLENTEIASVAKHLVLFDTDTNLYNTFLESANQNGTTPVLIQPGEAFEILGKTHYKVNPASKNDFVKLLEALQQEKISFHQICYAWAKEPFKNEETFLKEALDNGIYSFLYLCQSIITQKASENYQIVYLFQGQTNNFQPQNEAVNGFAKSLHLEHSNVLCKTLEIQTDNIITATTVNAVLAEFNAETAEELTIRYKENQRFTRKLKNIPSFGTETTTNELALKEKGVYVITGGAGGLGFIFAEYLAKQCKARLILTGRSQLSEEKKARLTAIESLGAEVLYMPTDVSKAADVTKLVAEGKKKFGAINGIIHSAGVLRDSSLRNKTLEEMSAVFAPKVFGTFYLDEATKNEKLDFFVTFSSMAAVGGNMGQSDYSYANHFMDTFAMRRTYQKNNGERSGKSLSLDWSIWADGGMQLDAQMEMFFKKNLGIQPLSIATGTGAFAKGLLSEQTQLVVVEGMQEKMEIAWGIRKKEVVEEEVAVQESTNAGTATQANGEAAALVQENLVRIAMDFLKAEEDDVSLDKILLDIGFDSIGLASYANAINDIYGTDVTPVLFFEYPSINEITKYLATEHQQAVLNAHNLAGEAQPAAQTAAKAAPVAKETGPEPAATFSGINKGWNPDQVQTQVNGQATGSGISTESRFIDCPIAIVGIGGVMPKSRNMKEYWENLKNEENMISVVPRDRWIWEDYDGDPITEKNKTNSKYGGFIEDADKFDPLFFGISPREAEMMDPQQRVFLETVWSTIEDSGYKVSDLSGTKTGLFVGVAVHDYTDLMNGLNVELDGYTASGNSHCMLANRISFLLNLRGPSAPIDTACSSSLIAVHRAIESIHTGSSDMAIVGGVQLMLTPAAHISFGMAGMLSSDGRCKTFDKDANGYVRGEGSGAIFLKPLAQAEADNDQIYAVIKSTAENHGGKATMLTAPNPHAQAELLVEAYEKAQVDPTTVGYIECHGTGTSLGDPIEIRALVKAFNELYQKNNLPAPQKPHIGLSSVKTNIGHLETAAGISSLLKAVLAIKHKHIPASLHFNELNPHINLKGTPFHVVGKTTPWEPLTGVDGKEVPLRAGVSSFGFGGANAHIVIEEYVPKQTTQATNNEGPFMFVLSAKNTNRLKDYAQSVIDYLEKYEESLLSLTYTFQTGRDAMAERLGFTVNSHDELIEKLNLYISEGAAAEHIYTGNVKKKKNPLSATAVNELFENKDHSGLLTAWIEGQDIDWINLYKENKPKRIHIPTYPFARESYWFDYDPNAATANAVQAALHPLLHKNTSVLKQQSYTSSFNGSEYFLNDYQASGSKTLTIGGFLEMADAAVLHAAFPNPAFKPIEFQNINLISPFEITQKSISIALFQEEDDSITFETYSEKEGQEIIHSDGVALIDVEIKPQQIDIEALKKQMDRSEMNQHKFFEALVYKGLNGYHYPEIKTILKGDRQLLVHLKLSEELQNISENCVIHPAIVESALHATSILWNSENYNQIPGIPIELEYLKVASPCVAEMYVWIRYSRGKNENNNQVKLDIDLIDMKGNVCISLKSLKLLKEIHETTNQLNANEFEHYLESIYGLIPNGNHTNGIENVESEFERLLDENY